MASDTLRKVDYSAQRTNQIFQIVLLVGAFVSDTWQVVAFVSVVMIIGTAFPTAALFTRIYRHILKPLGVRPDVVPDNPEPHRFSHGIGATFLAASTAALLLGLPTVGSVGWVVGWVLAWIIIALTALNLAGFCVGCFTYYQLNKLGTPGFRYSPVDTGVLPGRHPRKAA